MSVFLCLNGVYGDGQENPKVWFLSVRSLGRCGPRYQRFFYMYVEYQKNHIKLDFNSTLKCFSTTDFWWMYLTRPLDNIYRTPTQNCNGLVTASTTFVTDFAYVK